MAVQVPLYYEPRPYQQAAWARRLSGKYDYYLKIWHRQCGKDTDDIQFALYQSYMNPGTQSAYVGLDNKWIRRNIWDKYIDGRRHFDSYPDDIIEPLETRQQVKFNNNPQDLAPALIQYIGFKESESLIGSSYDRFFISELSLYRRNAFDLILAVNRQHPLASRTSISLPQLRPYHILSYASHSSVYHAPGTLEGLFSRNGLDPDLSYSDSITMCSIVAADPTAIALVVDSYILRSFDDLAYLRIEGVPAGFHQTFFCYRDDAQAPEIVQRFVEFFRKNAPSTLSQVVSPAAASAL